MKTATIRIRRDTATALTQMGERFVKAWHEGKSDADTFEFESPKALFTVLTPKRWELIERLQALGEVSLRALARALERDVKRVHGDAAMLLEWGADRANGERQTPCAVREDSYGIRFARSRLTFVASRLRQKRSGKYIGCCAGTLWARI